jgi:hypothetical protein
MNNQGKLFRGSFIAGIAGLILSIVIMIAFGHVTGGAVAVVTMAVVGMLVVAAVAICVALATYREQGRKAGSLPLIYAVIAFPVGLLLVPLYFAVRFPGLVMLAMIAILTSVPAVVIGLVKKFSVKAAPVDSAARVVVE